MEDKETSLFDIDLVIAKLINLRFEKPHTPLNLPLETIEILITTAQSIFQTQPMLLELKSPLKIVGDIHGQYYDLLRLFSFCGFPPQHQYLFLGDYVDRGRQNIETICLMLAYKIKYPDQFFMLRGNHESMTISRLYGFYEECKRRYSVKLWKQFIQCFRFMPIAAVISNRILCMHGGLSPELTKIEQINDIPRPSTIADRGLMCDLLWSDPDPNILGWGENERGVSYIFGRKVLADFLKANDLDVVVRAHQVVEDGYEFFGGKKLVTIFSAPNYCDEFDNCAGVLVVPENLECRLQVLQPKDYQKEFDPIEAEEEEQVSNPDKESLEPSTERIIDLT